MDVTSTSSRRPAQGGPPLASVAAGFAALFVTGLVASSVVGDGTFPSPFSDPAVIQAYFAGESTAVLVGAVFQFAAAVPLAIFAAAVHARLHQLGVRVAGATIALTGGLLASGFATLSACSSGRCPARPRPVIRLWCARCTTWRSWPVARRPS